MRRSVVVVAAVAALLGVPLTGCAAPQFHPAGMSVPDPSAAPSDPPALLREVHRELAAMKESHYRHRTVVSEQRGVFDYDCSGFVDYALGRVLPADLAALPTDTSSRPLAADFERHLRSVGERRSAADPWRAVASVAELEPGDVVAWLATEDSTTDDTGHVMIVVGRPVRDAVADRWLVEVADSTVSPHARDSRGGDDDGLGTGTIGLETDGQGRPTAFAWRGGISTRWKATEISLGRPT